MATVLDRFLTYVSYDTQSADESDTFPSTLKQKELAKRLVQELQELGASNARMDQWGYVYATLPATVETKAPSIGFIAHMDTATELSGKDVKPRVVKNYDGGDIILNEALGIVTRAADFPRLQDLVGQDLVVTDGTTLLGADDKAGIAEIMAFAAEAVAKPFPHGPIQIAFTPDEEVGGGVDHFDVQGFGADFAYTLDGGALGSIDYENFNACSAVVEVKGLSIHPGSAKGKMKNASLIAMEFHSMLPVFENPAFTEGYEGFAHLTDMRGEVESARLRYIIRDHDRDKFEQRKARFTKIAAYLNEKYGDCISLSLKDGYYNMKEAILPHPQILELAKAAMREMGIEPHSSPVRGGTDGARLSFMGLPCPNLNTGGMNAHGRHELVSVQAMERVQEMLRRMAALAVG